jgi:hypothetical protein
MKAKKTAPELLPEVTRANMKAELHHKPNREMIYLDRDELEVFLLSVRIKPQSEIEDAASTYIITGKHGR